MTTDQTTPTTMVAGIIDIYFVGMNKGCVPAYYYALEQELDEKTATDIVLRAYPHIKLRDFVRWTSTGHWSTKNYNNNYVLTF